MAVWSPGGFPGDVAVVLKERGIPFVFGTGYNISAVLPESLAGSPVIAKPYQLSELQQVIRRVIIANSATPVSLASVSGTKSARVVRGL